MVEESPTQRRNSPTRYIVLLVIVFVVGLVAGILLVKNEKTTKGLGTVNGTSKSSNLPVDISRKSLNPIVNYSVIGTIARMNQAPQKKTTITLAEKDNTSQQWNFLVDDTLPVLLIKNKLPSNIPLNQLKSGDTIVVNYLVRGNDPNTLQVVNIQKQ